LPACLPPGWRPASSAVVDHLYSVWVGAVGTRRGVRHFHQLYTGAARIVRTLEFDDIVEFLEAHLPIVVAAEAPRRVFVHAGVVGWQGRAILLPGPTSAGKTSLVAALIQAGASYYSDEYAVLDARGFVHAYPRPLAIRDELGGRQRRVTAAELGATTGVQPLPVGVVIACEYRKDARWRPRRLSPGRALLALLANTVPARIRPDAAMATLRAVVTDAPVFKSPRGEAKEVTEPLLDLVRMHESRALSGT